MSSAPAQPFSSAIDELVRRLLGEMAAAYERGERPVAEDFLTRHPELRDQPEAAAELIYEEVCLREQHGESVSTAALLRRFPQWRGELEMLLDCRRLFEPEPPPRFPVPGEMHGEFRLLAELGRGAAGVVFLATQPLLADRPVVLKLTRCAGSEHLRLARLQHTHIVPLYSAQDDPARRLRALCMPYFGGTSLSRLLAALESQAPAQRTGKDLLDALDAVQADSPVAVPARGSARLLLARASYAQAVCWIGSCLAGALEYAHEHGLLHLDLKPGNVLLTADGLPMLLDFHLAREPLTPGCVMAEGVGGTPDYMSPEQRAALDAVRAGRPVPAVVDSRSDLFSLGVLLYRALGGSLPVDPGSAQELRRANPGVSVGLAALLARCLADDPRDRYPDAAALGADLQRHLKDLPLRGVPNRSLAERWQKWRRRRPYTLPLTLTLAAVLGAAVAGLLGHFQQGLDQGRAALAEGRARLEERRYAEAVDALHRGLRAADRIPFHDDLGEALRELLRRAEQARVADARARAAAELHVLADRVRLLIGSDALPPAARRGLEASCRSFWERREPLLAHLVGTEPRQAAAVRQDFLDLALFWSDLRVALAPAGAENAARHEALRLLAEVERVFGPSPVLCHRREIHAAAAGLEGAAREARRRRSALPPRNAWEHVALGRSYLAEGDLRQAAAHFDRALALEPDQLWPSFYKGLCACRLGDHEDAVAAFSVCIGLAPREARCYYNRACAYEGCGRPERALRDCDRALQLEPTLAVAALKRGALYYQQKEYWAALADLRRALEGGADPAAALHGIALVQLAQGERDAALASLQAVLRHAPQHAEARRLLDNLRR